MGTLRVLRTILISLAIIAFIAMVAHVGNMAYEARHDAEVQASYGPPAADNISIKAYIALMTILIIGPMIMAAVFLQILIWSISEFKRRKTEHRVKYNPKCVAGNWGRGVSSPYE